LASPTETRIHALCAEAIVAKDAADIERIVSELRKALNEHIELARNSLGAQATIFADLGKPTTG